VLSKRPSSLMDRLSQIPIPREPSKATSSVLGRIMQRGAAGEHLLCPVSLVDFPVLSWEKTQPAVRRLPGALARSLARSTLPRWLTRRTCA